MSTSDPLTDAIRPHVTCNTWLVYAYTDGVDAKQISKYAGLWQAIAKVVWDLMRNSKT